MITTKAELGVYVISFVASLTGEFNHSQRLVVGCETIVCQKLLHSKQSIFSDILK